MESEAKTGAARAAGVGEVRTGDLIELFEDARPVLDGNTASRIRDLEEEEAGFFIGNLNGDRSSLGGELDGVAEKDN